jgi:hypothetical protein
MKVFVVIQTFGAAGENNFASSVHRSYEGARAKAKEDCFLGHGRPHDCDDRLSSGSCEGTWWEIEEWELLP